MSENSSSNKNGAGALTAHVSGHKTLLMPKNISVHIPGTEDQDSWVITYIDVITLLLTMFVMLLAYSSQNQHGFKEVQDALKGEVSRPNVVKPVSEKQIIKQKLAQFSAVLEQKKLGREVSYHFEQGRVVLQFGEKILFPSGEAALSEVGQGIMAQLLPVLSASDNNIVIEGHTDNIPISNNKFASNWELSSARAATVVRYLVDQHITPDRLSAVGFADTRPIGDNRTDIGRARNRRVTFSVSYEE